MCVASCRETTAILATILLINLFQCKNCVSLTYLDHVGRDLDKSEDSLTQFIFKCNHFKGIETGQLSLMS